MKSIKWIKLIVLSLIIFGCTKVYKPANQIKKAEFGLVIHGGAGYMVKENYSDEQVKEYKAKLNEALEAGYKILENGGESLDAVVATINILENSPLFNAGKGAVFTADGTNELDASIMNGADLNAGAVAGVKKVKNPINLARKVMEESKHVMLSGSGAETFAENVGVELVDEKYFYVEERWNSLQRAKESEKKANKQSAVFEMDKNNKFGTVGCAALDKNGNLSAGTSTGGMTNKKYGRIGDSPVIGAGTYANNKTCAISSTGHGEFFIRNVVAYDISALMEYNRMTLKEAAERVVNKKLKEQKGNGGIIGIDRLGNVTMTFNTPGMFRAYKLDSGKKEIKIFKE